ncbi:hypothetical protein UlMin_017155 [Ulmus minor]
MIVRTYGRRSRGISRTFSDSLNDVVHDDDPFQDSLTQEPLALPYSSQESSSHWSAFDFDPYGLDSSQGSLKDLRTKPSFDDSNGGGRKAKKARIGKKELEVNKNLRPSIPATSTLMEAQEFGEMMEHVDEVNFALDGLRKNQPVRIRRASLLSLLSICGTAQQRRLLRTQGMAKTIIDAVLGLSFDDLPSNLAAAALLYALTCDGQDDHLLESPISIRFLIRLLKPIVSNATEEKAPKIGCKLLALRAGPESLQSTKKKLDSSSVAIFSQVHEILVSCKVMKSKCGDDSELGKAEVCPKWISLLTMEKACLSTICLEETTGTVRKSGGNFKEKLRELGGLDAIFEVAMKCHSDMESWMEDSLPSTQDAEDKMEVQCLVLLLKCLKIMENATFLSKDNQNHLLGMKRKRNSTGTPLMFTELVMSVIKTLSALYLLKSSSSASSDEKTCVPSNGTGLEASDSALMSDLKGNGSGIFIDYPKKNSSEKSFNINWNSEFLSTAKLEYSISETTCTSMTDTCSLKARLNSSASGSCSGTSRSSTREIHSINNNGFRKNADLSQRFSLSEDVNRELLEESEDPFAFDEDDFGPSKWEVLSGKQNLPRTQRNGLRFRELEDDYQSQMIVSKRESINEEDQNLHEASCSTVVDEEISGLLADCLLTAVKVLMNLTNDNPVGCQQIASCGGLEVMSSLIADHFPQFSSSSSPLKENTLFIDLDSQADIHLNDQELDFLVAILGLLVNLVEKDGQNRSRLAATSVQLHNSEGLEEESSKDVIPLLCSIFLANQGAGEVVQEGMHSPGGDEEAVMLQGEKEAEKMIVEAYSALLLAFLSTESKSIRDAITDCLPDHKLSILVPVLDRFVAFHLSLNMISPETHKTVTEVIESCRMR